ncbi:LamG-like jellyroll fold domain-containing protein [Methylovulum miyakonense]|uniref:LamG-like jellyroll fold domain-containing protein n=1 Tax=Methylovulum miyakonense TaxID=645578 RepID=UPI00037F4E25|nr:LamG-like jellyroll fold domain-containing protein [Methylovulum miyakonense]
MGISIASAPGDKGVRLVDPVSVSFEGKVVLLARAAKQSVNMIYYNVSTNAPVQDGDAGFVGWESIDLTQIGVSLDSASTPLRVSGMGLISAPPTFEPALADAPFCAVSDNRYIYLFRLSTVGTLYLNRFLLVSVSASDSRADAGGEPQANFELQPAWEVRYRRSGLRDTPAGPQDTLGYRGMTGDPFIEPTMELVEVQGVLGGNVAPVTPGNFAVILTPSATGAGSRWQFVVATADSVTVSSYAQLKSGLPQLDPGLSAVSSICPGGSNPQLTFTKGVDAVLYGDQEAADPNNPDQGTLKRGARVMIAAPSAAGMAIFDFGLLPDGTLPAYPNAQLVQAVDGGEAPYLNNVVGSLGGITICSALLENVQASAPPRLLESKDGLIRLYYAGLPVNGDAPFMVAQYSTMTARVSVQVPWIAGNETGQIDMVANGASFLFSNFQVMVEYGISPDICNVAVNYGNTNLGEERWVGVPRQADQFVAVLMGNASYDPNDAGVKNGTRVFFDYTGQRPIARLPLLNAENGATTGYLGLVSARGDVPLQTVTATSDGEQLQLTLQFTAHGKPITQTWQGLPVDPYQASVILRGDAANSGYYAPGENDTLALSLLASGDPLILFLKSGALDVSIAISESATPNTVGCSVNGGGAVEFPANQQAFAAQLLSQYPDIFLWVSPGSALGLIIQQPEVAFRPDQNPSGGLSLAALASLFGVIPPSSTDPVGAGAVTAAVMNGRQYSPDQQYVIEIAATDGIPLTLYLQPGITTASVEILAASSGMSDEVDLLFQRDATTPLVRIYGMPLDSEEFVSRLAQEAGVAGAILAIAVNPAGGGIVAGAYDAKLAEGASSGLLFPQSLLQAVAVFTGFPANGLPPMVQKCGAAAQAPDAMGGWMAAPSQEAIELDGSGLVWIDADQNQFNLLDPATSMTLEAWIAPGDGGTVMAFNGAGGPPCLTFGSLQAEESSYILISVPGSSDFLDSNTLTFEMWVNPTPNAQGSILGVYDPLDNNVWLSLGLNPQSHLFVVPTPSPVPDGWNPTLTPNIWNHVAITATVSASASETIFTIFLNGIPQPTYSIPITVWRWTKPSGNALFFYIGGRDKSAYLPPTAACSLAEVRFWQSARTQDELLSTMFSTLMGSEPGLEGYWRLLDAPGMGAIFANSCLNPGAAPFGLMNLSDTQAVSGAQTGVVQPSFVLATATQPCLSITGSSAADSSNAMANFCLTSGNNLIQDQTQFTMELWLNPATAGAVLCLVCVDQPGDLLELELALNSTLNPYLNFLGVGKYEGSSWESQPSSIQLDPGVWTHLAVAGSLGSDGVWRYSLYINGVQPDAEIATPEGGGSLSTILSQGAYFSVGEAAQSNAILSSAVADYAQVRLWQSFLSPENVRRGMTVALTGYEDGLLGSWALSEDPMYSSFFANGCAATGGAVNLIIYPSADQPISQGIFTGCQNVIAAVGGSDPVMTDAVVLADAWNHVAVAWEAGCGVAFQKANGNDVDCGNSAEFDLGVSLSIEAWILVPAFPNAPCAIVSKWGDEPASESFYLGLDSLGNVTAHVLLADASTRWTVTSTGVNVTDGKAHHLVFTYASSAYSPPQDDNISGPQSQGNLALFVDGQAVAVIQTTSGPQPRQGLPTFWLNQAEAAIQTTPTPVILGATAMPTSVFLLLGAIMAGNAYFQGSLGGVRIWSVALSAVQVQQAMRQRRAFGTDGCIAAWWFMEQEGDWAYDSVSNNNARLADSSMWTIIGELSSLAVYVNGEPAPAIGPAPEGLYPGYNWGDPGFAIGGSYLDQAELGGFLGQIDEVRIWNIVRTGRQIDATQFSTLKGDESGLVGYWNFDNNTFNDQTGNGNNGVGIGQTPTFVASAAPVSNEGPSVLNVYGGQATTFQSSLSGTPAIIEFADVDRGADGTLVSTLQRGYYFVDGFLNITPGFRVGDLRMIYLGQVQTAPTLVGFIEGAPPVPSENLTNPWNGTYTSFYYGTSSVTLTEAESTAVSFSVGRDAGQSMDISGSLGFSVDVNASASIGFIAEVSGTIAEAGFNIAALAGGMMGSSTGETTVRSSSWAQTISDTYSLRGQWEDPGNILNTAVSQRFLPSNTGYALVTSMTADLYVLQLNTTGAMAGKIAVPNLEIPPDKNIIVFQMDPGYIKNGTLDGKIGLLNDPDYPAADFERGSYFKPLEAYRLKADIERQTLALGAYYEQFNPQSQTALGSPVFDNNSTVPENTEAEGKLFVNRSNGGKSVRKSIVNSYVWTAAGGLHAEQEQFTDERQTTWSASANSSVNTGFSMSGKALFGPGVVFGPTGSFDFLYNWQVSATASKTKTESTGFGLNVAVTGEPILEALDSSGQNYTRQLCPGKVSAYRFNAFYLHPDAANADAFTSIVDQSWLRSSDPNAVALREASIAGNEVWRVLYRVTYVSRVPPAFSGTPNETLQPDFNRTIDVSDNAALIALILDNLGDKEATPANVGTAITAVVNPAAANSPLGALVPWWDTVRPNADPAWMGELLYDVLSYMLTGFATGAVTNSGQQAATARLHPQTAAFLRAPRHRGRC